MQNELDGLASLDQLGAEYAASLAHAEHAGDFEVYSRAEQLLNEIRRRQSAVNEGAGDVAGQVKQKFGTRFILDVAGHRYFELLKSELQGLQRLFSAEELGIILNTTCLPVWERRQGMTLAGAVADDQGVDNCDADTPVCVLIRKLSKLSSAQCLALVDACERFWRTPASDFDSVQTVAARCGLELA